MTVSNQIIQVLDALCEKFGMAIDWTSENVIPYLTTLCAKLVTWEIWSSVAWIAIMTVLSIVGIVIVKKTWPIFKKGIESQRYYEDEWSVGWCFMVVGLVFLCVTSIVIIGFQVFDIVKCVTFPEIYIYEYIQRLINGG